MDWTWLLGCMCVVGQGEYHPYTGTLTCLYCVSQTQALENVLRGKEKLITILEKKVRAGSGAACAILRI